MATNQNNTSVSTIALANPTSLYPVSFIFCQICGDRGSGLHYGVVSCNGCRSFFLRAISSPRKYKCQDNDECVINLKQRNICKSCRYRKCISMGMGPGGVGWLRSRSNKWKNKDSEKVTTSTTMVAIDNGSVFRATQTFSISHLLESFLISQDLTKNHVQVLPADLNTANENWKSFVQSLHNSWYAEVFCLVEWCKRIPGFKSLDVNDQVIIFRATARKHGFLWSAFQSASLSREDSPHIFCGNNLVNLPVNCIDFRKTTNPEIGPAAVKVLSNQYNMLVKPMKAVNANVREILCFETLFLLDPNLPGLHKPNEVQKLRTDVMNVIMQERDVDPAFFQRILDLHLVLPAIDSISLDLLRLAKRTSHFSVLDKVSKLLEDVLLADIE